MRGHGTCVCQSSTLILLWKTKKKSIKNPDLKKEKKKRQPSWGCASRLSSAGSEKVQPETLFIKVCVSGLIADMFHDRGSSVPSSTLHLANNTPFVPRPTPLLSFYENKQKGSAPSSSFMFILSLCLLFFSLSLSLFQPDAPAK